MIKPLLVFLLILVLVVFAIMNVHGVPLNLIVGGPVNVKAIYLVLASYFLGMITAFYIVISVRIRAKRREQLSGRKEVEEPDTEDE